MPEIQAATSLFQVASQVEKLGIVAILFLICIVLAWLLRKSVNDKDEVIDKLDTHREDINKILANEREDRRKFDERMVECMTRINQSIEEIKNLTKQQQEFSKTVIQLALGSKNG